MKHHRQHLFSEQAGFTILETMIACAVLTIASVGILGLFAVCISQNKAQGEVGTRTTEYCQDKMEQLLALSYLDTATNTIVPPGASVGTGLSNGGGTDPKNPVANYVDYFDFSGGALGATATGAFYTRVWQISTAGNIKTITVVTAANSAVDGRGPAPQSQLVSFKTNTQ